MCVCIHVYKLNIHLEAGCGVYHACFATVTCSQNTIIIGLYTHIDQLTPSNSSTCVIDSAADSPPHMD